MKKNILITGSEGFIGSHLIEKLVLTNKFNVKALVLYNFKNDTGWLKTLDKKILKNIEIIHGDIRDYDLMLKISKKINIIVNLAALIGIPYSYDAPRSYIDTNIIGTQNILQCTKENKIERLIQTSTSEVFGNTKFGQRFNESSYQYAQSPYAASKIASDQMTNAFYSSYDLPATIIRPFNTYGPRQSERAIIPTVINQILKKSKNIKLGNLYAFRDLNYIEDTVSAYLKLINTQKKIDGEIYNVGSGYTILIKDLVFMIKEIMKSDIAITFDNYRARPKKSEVSSLICDNRKFMKNLNWKPKFGGRNGLKKGIEKTIEWFKANSYYYIKNSKFIK
jgi:NAD dependent epimerase/dehydratase